MKRWVILLMLLAAPALAVEERWTVDPPTNPDGTVLSDLHGIWFYWAPQRLTWSDDGKGTITYHSVVTVGPTNRVWMPVGTYTVTVSAVSAPYSIWAVAVASYGAESDPVVTNARIGRPTTVKTKKVTP